MKINHIALYVDNLEGMKEFYIKYFGATANQQYHNPNTGLKTYFLSFEDGAKIEIMNRPQMEYTNHVLNAVGYIHIAFSTGSKERVDELTYDLANAGYTVLNGPRTTGDGYYESCILDPENNQIEIVE